MLIKCIIYEAAFAERSSKRHRAHKFLWKKRYMCHRGGQPRTRKDKVPGGKSGKPRPNQKASKKVGCNAAMEVVCYKNTPDKATVTFRNMHCNHAPNTTNDLQYLPRAPRVHRGYPV